MSADVLLAVAHHLLAFGVLAVLVAELAVAAGPPDADWRARLARLDAHYGAMAAMLILVGVGRLIWGAKGAGYFLSNPFFWAKMAAFAAVGLLSIAPTLTILRWRKMADLPGRDDIARLRGWLRLEILVFGLIPIFAALMVRRAG